MAYQAEITRVNPTCFYFLLDQSGSMTDPFGGSSSEGVFRKADFLSDVVNRTLYELIMTCTRPEEVRNYFYISIIGYGGTVGSAFGGTLAGRDTIPISEVADNPLRVETRMKKVSDGAGGLVEQQVKFPVWVDPQATNGTPMCSALQQLEQLIDQWLSDLQHKLSFPPTILHITDGESTDGDPTEVARRIISKGVNDGKVLFYNCHLSSERTPKIEYPSSLEGPANQFAKILFDFSSVLPDKFRDAAKQIGLALQPNARGFVFNADATSLVQFFDIGTKPANLR